MLTLLVVVLHELGQHGPKMPLVEDDEMVETLSAQGRDHSLRDSVGLGARIGKPLRIKWDALLLGRGGGFPGLRVGLNFATCSGVEHFLGERSAIWV